MVTVKETTKFFGDLGIGILCTAIVITSIVTAIVELFVVALGIALIRIGFPAIYHSLCEMLMMARLSDEYAEKSTINNQIIRFKPKYECYLALDEFELEGEYNER